MSSLNYTFFATFLDLFGECTLDEDYTVPENWQKELKLVAGRTS